MSESHHHHPSDEELLDNAIDISQLEEAEGSSPPPASSKSSAKKADGFAPIEIASGASDSSGASRIHAFGREKRHEDEWSRTPNTTGTGAIHVKTFVAKLRLDAIDYLDRQVNEWLDAHPQYEVKFVTTTVGDLMGKMKEQALFMNVWV